MKPHLFKLIACMALITQQSLAQMPVLSVGGNQESKEVYLQSLDIQVDVTGNIASTKFTMTFKNHTGKILEGELLFPLPDGVTVSHYALDINGKMRQAVPVEKAKATQVFEEIVQRRIDPGLLERVEGNNFRTRIYPISSHGTRTISIGYEEELTVENGSLRYNLPMAYKAAIKNFTLKATVWQGAAQPRIDKGNPNGLVFDKEGTNYTASLSRKDFRPERSISFSLPVQKDIPQISMQSASGSYYFFANCFPEAKIREKKWDNHIGIIWDASLSGLKRDIDRELGVLEQIIVKKKDVTISLYLLNNRITSKGIFTIKNGNWNELKNTLTSITYDGGTNFAALKTSNLPAKEFLFFSDGLSTLSDADIIRPTSAAGTTVPGPDFKRNSPDKPIHCIVSAATADYSALKLIAARTNGKFINLNALTDKQLSNELTTETLNFIGIEKPATVREVYPSISTPVRGNFSIAGILDAREAQVSLLFGYGNKVEMRIPISLNAAKANQQGNIHRIWAQKKINELDMAYEQYKDELTELAKQFGIVTRNTSLMVLETLDDYIRYDIVPPTELQEQYFRIKKNRAEQWQQSRDNLLENAVAIATTLKEWWNTDFTKKPAKYPQPDKEQQVLNDIAFEQEIVAVDQDIQMDMATEDALMEVMVVSSEEALSAVVPGLAVQSSVDKKMESPRRASTSQPTIRITPLKQDSKYMKSLKGNADEDYSTYLNLREEYINTPTFYFDMADWFYRLNDREKALRILTSIAELEVENASLYRLLGYRLKEYEEYSLEVYICKKVIQWRPMEPQSYRDYALALADLDNQQDALNELYAVLTQSYAKNIEFRSAGIEEVVVTELNRMLAKNAKLKSSEIDPRIIQPMPVDIRVVINWNMNNTDIDLHVTDPNKETCFYGHRSTLIGGRISNDITQGYGPEQFMLKNAVKGKYEVFVNYFGDTQVKAEGPSTIMLEIFTKYAGKEEKREVVCVQLSRERKATENGLLKVAEFEF